MSTSSATISEVSCRRSKFYEESDNTSSIFDTLPEELLYLILSFFQQNEESLFVSLVCKLWHSLVKHKPITVKKVISKYAAQGTISAILLVRQIINDNHKFFIKSLFRFGNKQVLQWAFEQILDKPTSIVKAAAEGFARGGHLEFLQALQQTNRFHRDFNICAEAVAGNSHNILHWIDEHLYPEDSPYIRKALFSAGKYGNKESLEYMISKGHSDYSYMYHGAIFKGRLDIIIWLCEQNCEAKDDAKKLGWYAGRGGHLNTMQWMSVNWKDVLVKQIAKGAAAGGHFHVLKYLEDAGVLLLKKSTISNAVLGGNIEIVKYLLEKGCEIEDYECLNALAEGNVEMLKWIYENYCNWNYITVESAARGGHLKALKWALENECRYDFNCGIVAAKYGHLKVLQYFYENGYKIDTSCLDVAIRESYMNIVQWLTETCHFKLSDNAFLFAVESGDLDTVKWIYSKGFTSNEASTIAAENGYLYILEWMKATGFKFDETLFEKAKEVIIAQNKCHCKF